MWLRRIHYIVSCLIYCCAKIQIFCISNNLANSHKTINFPCNLFRFQTKLFVQLNSLHETFVSIFTPRGFPREILKLIQNVSNSAKYLKTTPSQNLIPVFFTIFVSTQQKNAFTLDTFFGCSFYAVCLENHTPKGT